MWTPAALSAAAHQAAATAASSRTSSIVAPLELGRVRAGFRSNTLPVTVSAGVQARFPEVPPPLAADARRCVGLPGARTLLQVVIGLCVAHVDGRATRGACVAAQSRGTRRGRRTR